MTTDHENIASLITTLSNSNSLQSAQHTAAKRLLAYDGEIYPSDGCAITLSVLLQSVGIDVPDTFKAIELGKVLQNRGWKVIPVGQQKKGDVGSTCGTQAHHGYDHIYLVLEVMNIDEMVIADNQSGSPHFRFASGKGGKTPTTFFLRAE